MLTGSKSCTVQLASYIPDGEQRVESSQSGTNGKVSAEADGHVDDVQFNSLVENNLRYMQYTHGTFDALRRYRLEQLRGKEVQQLQQEQQEWQKQEPIPITRIISPFAQVQVNDSAHKPEDKDFAFTRNQPSPRSSESSVSERKAKAKTHVQDAKRTLLVQDSVKELKYFGRQQKVLDWVMKTDEESHEFSNAQELGGSFDDFSVVEKSQKKQQQKNRWKLKHALSMPVNVVNDSPRQPKVNDNNKISSKKKKGYKKVIKKWVIQCFGRN